MALTYGKVIDVISKPPDKRTVFGVNNVLPWFRQKSDLFKKLKTGKYCFNNKCSKVQYIIQ